MGKPYQYPTKEEINEAEEFLASSPQFYEVYITLYEREELRGVAKAMAVYNNIKMKKEKHRHH
jgi:hypothetical protein